MKFCSAGPVIGIEFRTHGGPKFLEPGMAEG